MQTSLWKIANRAASHPRHRFRNLYGLINLENLQWCWQFVRKAAAPGVDKVTYQEYEADLHSNIEDLVSRLKAKRYHARLVRRQYIPKLNGKLRPLGIPTTEDKLLQRAVAKILEAIFEQDYLKCSYGYRPKVGPKDAVRDLQASLNFGRYRWVVEADIKSFFDNINHDWLMRMLGERIDDKPFLHLIRKWLKAGILDTDGQVVHPVTGTPQGGVVSPILANLYLHYALDLWFERRFKPSCRGSAMLIRFADDFVCAFEHQTDAERFYDALGQRLGKFGLDVAPDKTRILRFSRFDLLGRNGFEFLGFEFRWRRSRRGRRTVNCRTSPKKFKASLSALTAWIKEKRHCKISWTFHALRAKLRGYWNYYGIIGNSASLQSFFYLTKRILFKWLNRRSQRRSYTWKGFAALLTHFQIPYPRITERAGPTQLKWV